jgi:hypothetical protein
VELAFQAYVKRLLLGLGFSPCRRDKRKIASFMMKNADTRSLASDQTWVLSSLEHDQLVKARKHPIPRRHLKGPELLVLWALRLYLLFMMAVVAYQVWIAAH